ncbi:histidinol-phosphatase [Candidatus Viadribacter manganicus]|uniref:Histidinol-phosphatase n=1 Tax=Candidatus Viadribacter manganicus TaxID=1759059 RepID=A0A1B1AHQ6_9PROT|nr:histidinol-phosphatase [Candidatus Viadribacter manganicus]ANP46092.1 inositol monophosphatase [Candidatus Viadribacter manganicus]
MPVHDTARLLAFADTLADAARAAILPYFRAPHTVESKGSLFDPVTDADKAAERAMRALIEAQFPEHGVLGEEYGETPGVSGYEWVLDPIDGTRAFISGLPLWGVLIGLTFEGKPIVGVMDQPYLRERYRGWNDGAELVTDAGVSPLKVRACASLSEAILSTTDPYILPGDEGAAFSRVRQQAKLTRFGYDCYAYAMVASGTMDCVIESGLKPFDICALIPILNGAGGGVCTWDGGDASRGGQVLAFGDPRARDAALGLLR